VKAPTAAELVEAVRERMDRAVDEPVGGFEARVVRNVLAIVERELALGARVESVRDELLHRFAASNDEALADAIRNGALDDRAVELRQALLALAEQQLLIDNPRW